MYGRVALVVAGGQTSRWMQLLSGGGFTAQETTVVLGVPVAVNAGPSGPRRTDTGSDLPPTSVSLLTRGRMNRGKGDDNSERAVMVILIVVATCRSGATNRKSKRLRFRKSDGPGATLQSVEYLSRSPQARRLQASRATIFDHS